MRYLVAAFVFFLTIGMTIKTIASAPQVETCKAENTEKCTDAAKMHSGAGKMDHHSEMNSLFPEKKKDPKVTGRPTTVDLTAPKFLSKVSGKVTLQWKAANGADAYHIQVATDPNFKWLLVNEHFVKATSFDLPALEAGKKYFWRAAAVNTLNDSGFTKSNFSSSAFEVK